MWRDWNEEHYFTLSPENLICLGLCLSIQGYIVEVQERQNNNTKSIKDSLGFLVCLRSSFYEIPKMCLITLTYVIFKYVNVLNYFLIGSHIKISFSQLVCKGKHQVLNGLILATVMCRSWLITVCESHFFRFWRIVPVIIQNQNI